jgi:streptogramin lyase
MQVQNEIPVRFPAPIASNLGRGELIMRFRFVLAVLILALVFVGCGGTGVPGSTGAHILVADSSNNRIVSVDSFTGVNWRTFGTVGSGTGELNGPFGLALDSLGRIYIADYFNNRIVRINDMTGAGWISYGVAGSGTGQFNGPYKIAVDSVGRIYVSDSENDRIVRINDMNGSGWVSFGTSGSGVNQFSTPIGIAVASNFKVYITDWENDRVVRIDDMTGSGWTTLGTSGTGVGQFEEAVDIDLDNLGHMIVCDRSGRIILTGLMSTTGWAELPVNTPQAVDAVGFRLYFVDQSAHKVSRVDSIGGGNLVSFGSNGSGTNQFSNPTAVRVQP